ncbi:MAG: hypothetical protein MPJ78_18770 [Hyphomicrobiaceae bacterium]|nr:hypothetical protein [Hyphomicrobiaceae bacterium]
MKGRIFISCINKAAIRYARVLEVMLREAGYDPYLSADHPEYGRYLLEKIKTKIRRSDLVIGIISNELSVFVYEELAYAEDRVPVIRMVEAGTRVDASGFTHGREYELFEAGGLEASALRVLRYIEKHGIKNLPKHPVPADPPERAPMHEPGSREHPAGWAPGHVIFQVGTRRILPVAGGAQTRLPPRPLLQTAPESGPGGTEGVVPVPAGDPPQRAGRPRDRLRGSARPEPAGDRPGSSKTGSRKQEMVYARISKSLYSAKDLIEDVLIEYKTRGNHRGGGRIRHKSKILGLQKDLSDLSDDLDRIMRTSGGHLHAETRDRMGVISRLCRIGPSLSRRRPSACIVFYADLLREISDAAVNLMKVFPKYPEERMFAVSCDRSVYPAGSRIHAWACAPDAESWAPMRFEIFDSKMEMIDVKITSARHSRPPDQSVATHGVSFRMRKYLYKVDEEYTLRATYGNRQDEDKFVIDQCEPIIQACREPHEDGDYVVIIVIDPNSNLDSEAVEYVGDRADSRLVIETDHGRIGRYRLEETGPSTGIFRSVVRILRVRDDGTVAPRHTGKREICRTQDPGMDDGYIAARPDGRITITYKYGSRSVRLEYVVADLPLEFGYG